MFSIDKVRQLIEERENEFSKIRREFHQFPELGMEEYKTTKEICRHLENLGIDPICLKPTGVIGYIGPEDARVIALRADIDALKIKEETGLPFASKNEGCMHACGHDGHIAGLLGAASILKELESNLTVRVKLIFQPSEENTQGARHIMKQGVLHDVDAIFGLHLFSDMPYGLLNVEAGPKMAQTDRFTITLEGKGGHAGKPHLSVDATVMAAEFVMSAQTIVSRQVNPIEGAVVTIGSLHSGTQYNIISPKAVISGTCRSFSAKTAKMLKESLEKRAHAIADSYGGRAYVDYELGSHPPVINDEIFSAQILDEAKKLIPDGNFEKVPPLMLGEDFSWYMQEVPAVFAFVGCGKISGPSYPNHHPKFDIEEKALSKAVGLHLSAVGAFMRQKKIDKDIIL